MKTAFAYWGNHIAPVFDTARQVRIVEARGEQLVSETEGTLSEDLPFQRALELVSLGVGALVCGAISRPMHEMAVAYGIQVVPFVTGDLREVIQAWLKGDLANESFAMPGCHGQGHWRMCGITMKEHEMHGKGRCRMGKGGGQTQRGGGQGRGRMTGTSTGKGNLGTCLCPKCGQTAPHEYDMPCVERKCPKCGTAMIRQ